MKTISKEVMGAVAIAQNMFSDKVGVAWEVEKFGTVNRGGHPVTVEEVLVINFNFPSLPIPLTYAIDVKELSITKSYVIDQHMRNSITNAFKEHSK